MHRIGSTYSISITSYIYVSYLFYSIQYVTLNFKNSITSFEVFYGPYRSNNVTQVYYVTLLVLPFEEELYMLQNFIVDDETIFQCPFKTKLEITNYLLGLISHYDAATAQHSYNVANISVNFAKKLNLSPQTIKDISLAALLHDVGKIKIPQHILNKPETLTESEFEIIQKHSQYGFVILNQIQPLQEIAEAVRCHHEKFNGGGYPSGKAGDEIPLIAQILSITDVYEALTTDRTYRKAMTQKEAFQIIDSGRDVHFNPTLVDMFLLGGC